MKRMSKPIKGLFITVEGGEGSGKSTLLKRLKDSLEGEGRSVLLTREPGGTVLGEQIRQLVLEKNEAHQLDPMAELMLFLAGRAQHIRDVIRPALEDGTLVFCDRFNDSTVAYQGFGRGLDVPRVQEICDLVVGQITPAFTLLLDVDPNTGLERTQQAAGTLDRLESEEIEFHRRLHRGFHWLHEQDPHRIFVVDANRPAEQVYETAFSLIQDRLKEYV